MKCVHCGSEFEVERKRSRGRHRIRCDECIASGMSPIATSERTDHFIMLYKSGLTLQEIGGQYGISRERVRQMLKLAGVTGRDGGKSAKARQARARKLEAREKATIAEWGCTRAQLKSLRARSDRPHRAFSVQKRDAKARGIEFKMTLWEWWTIWQESGHWDERGRGQGYCMCRHGDDGPYAVGNVFIAPTRLNSSLRQNRKSDLPMGVSRSRGGYAAKRMIGGQTLHLGTFRTPNAAYAAYLAASPEDGVAA